MYHPLKGTCQEVKGGRVIFLLSCFITNKGQEQTSPLGLNYIEKFKEIAEVIDNFLRLDEDGKKALKEALAGRLLLEGKEYQNLTDETKLKEKLKSTA